METCLSEFSVMWGETNQFCWLIQWGSDVLLFTEEDILTDTTAKWQNLKANSRLLFQSLLSFHHVLTLPDFTHRIQWHSLLTLNYCQWRKVVFVSKYFIFVHFVFFSFCFKTFSIIINKEVLTTALWKLSSKIFRLWNIPPWEKQNQSDCILKILNC